MKISIKFLSLLVTLIIVVGLFSACDRKDEVSKEEVEEKVEDERKETQEKERVDSLVADISVQVEETWLPYYQEAAARVLKTNPDSTINFIIVESFDHLNILQVNHEENEDIADVFALPIERVHSLAQKEVLAEIDALTMAANVGGFGDYDAGFGGNFKIDGYYLAFPMNIETLISFVNTANAEVNSVDISSTIEFTDLDYQDILVPVFNAWYGAAFTNAADINMLGLNDLGELYSDLTLEFSELTPQQQDVFKALFNYWKAHDKAFTDAWNKKNIWEYMDTEFTTGGKNSVQIDGPWTINKFLEIVNLGEDLEVLPITQLTVAGNPLVQWQSGWGLAINARAEGEEEKILLSQAMIEEIVNPTYAIDFYEATGKILGNIDASVYERSNLSDIDKKVIVAVMTSYKVSPSKPMISEWEQVWDTWETSILSWETVKPTNVYDAYNEVKKAFDTMMLSF